MNEGIFETLKRIDGLKTKPERLNELSKHNSDFPIKALLDCVFNPNIKFLLPETPPPYRPSDKESDVQNVLKRDVRKMVYFVNTPQGQQLTPFKREAMFIELLEAVDPDDALLLLDVKNKKLPFKNITKDLVAKAFPGIDSKW